MVHQHRVPAAAGRMRERGVVVQLAENVRRYVVYPEIRQIAMRISKAVTVGCCLRFPTKHESVSLAPRGDTKEPRVL